MQEIEFNSCCQIDEIGDLDCLGGSDEWSKMEAAKFKNLIADNRGKILTLVDGGPDFNGGLHHKRQLAAVKKHGFKLLARLPRWEDYGDVSYHILLFGSKNFKLPRRGRKKAKK